MNVDDIPRIEIGTWPTPVRRLDVLSDQLGVEVWAKLEEDCGAWGGNKVRKLEHILYAAQHRGVRSVATWGAGTSNWAAAAAWHGPRHGFEVALGLGGGIPHGNRDLYAKCGTTVISLPRVELAPLAAAAARARAGPKSAFLPVGGSGGIGDIGATRTGVEIARAVAQGWLPQPARVFVATGTAGTVAGVCAGLGLEDLRLPVVAVKVADWPYGTAAMIHRRLRNIDKRLRGLGIRTRSPAPFDLDKRYLGPGYTRPTAASRAARHSARRDGLNLDGSYGAKAFAALLDTARRGVGPLLFLHTSPGPPPTAAP